MQSPTYTLLVNSCDAFEDCWRPFFRLLKEYWADLEAPVLLNTEHHAFDNPWIPVRASRVARAHEKRLPWSEMLLRCLDQVTTPQVLYVQEDYFLNGPVRGDIIEKCARLMRERRIVTIQLTTFGSDGPFHPTEDPYLWEIDSHAPYRLALQAALWEVAALRSYLRAHENAWQCEFFGSLRTRRTRETFLTINRELFAPRDRQVFPYVKTGIIKGRWYEPAVVDLFSKHDIDIDFSRRGFHVERSRFVERCLTMGLVVSRPLDVMRSLR